jgi:cytochrome P450
MASYAINAQNHGHVMPDTAFFAQVLDRANRADPYPLYARLRETPVVREDDGTYIIITHAEIRSLLHDKRLSSEDLPKSKHARTGNPLADLIVNPVKDWIMDTHRALIYRDPPDHTNLRRLVMAQFTPERVREIDGRVAAIIDALIGKMRGREEIDLVGDFSYPLPVIVICELLGIPQSDGAMFQGWSRTLAESLDPDRRAREEDRVKRVADYEALASYLSALIKEKRKRPAGDVLSGLAACKDKKLGRMGKYDLIATAVLLLVAGHETTVNLIANGMLTLLRHREWLERLRRDGALAPRVVEELLRFDAGPFPHAQDLGGNRHRRNDDSERRAARPFVPSGNRDPKRFPHPDLFDPDRADNPHFGFGGGPHYCVGAPIAKLEAETALVALAKRLVDPRLLEDPPPYRPGASLRGRSISRLGSAVLLLRFA